MFTYMTFFTLKIRKTKNCHQKCKITFLKKQINLGFHGYYIPPQKKSVTAIFKMDNQQRPIV